MANVYIFGAGGHARVIASFLTTTPIFVVDMPTDDDTMSVDEYFDKLPKGDVYIGIGANLVRRRFSERLRAYQIRMPPIVAPGAFVARDAAIGDGAVICAGAVIGSRAQIGRDTIVNTLSSLDHDCILGELSQVTPGVTIAGTVKIGSNCFFGIKSGVIPNKTIGDNSQVMAGSLIISDVPANVVMGGNPAEVVKSLPAV
jgi:sugar O-acyltransferase (sialic acid O-acetyltransferase NeuD family)